MAIIPIPQLNVFKASDCFKFACAINQSKIDNLAHESKLILAPKPSGNALGKFSVNPPPVICANAFSLPVSSAATAGRT